MLSAPQDAMQHCDCTPAAYECVAASLCHVAVWGCASQDLQKQMIAAVLDLVLVLFSCSLVLVRRCTWCDTANCCVGEHARSGIVASTCIEGPVELHVALAAVAVVDQAGAQAPG